MESNPVEELLKVLSKRGKLLELINQGITDKRELPSELNTSRATVDRGFTELRDAELITPRPHDPELTVLGKISLKEYDRFTDIAESKPVLRHLPIDAEFDMRIIEGAEITPSREIAPLEPYGRMEALVRQAEDGFVRGLSPEIYPQTVEFFHDQVMNAGLHGEFVFDDEVLYHLVTDYNQAIHDVLETGRVTIRRLHVPRVKYGVAIIDDIGVWVGSHDRGGGLRGAIVNTTDQAFEWAEEMYAGIRERSSPIDAEDIMIRGSPA